MRKSQDIVARSFRAEYLYNSDNNHWYVDDNTRGAGNCLYNAFAQAFYQLGIIKHKQQIADDHALALQLAREEGLAIPSYESLGYH